MDLMILWIRRYLDYFTPRRDQGIATNSTLSNANLRLEVIIENLPRRGSIWILREGLRGTGYDSDMPITIIDSTSTCIRFVVVQQQQRRNDYANTLYENTIYIIDTPLFLAHFYIVMMDEV